MERRPARGPGAGCAAGAEMEPRDEPLVGPYILRRIPEAEMETFLRQHHGRTFIDRWDFNHFEAMSAKELAGARQLHQRMGTPFRLDLGIFLDDECVGWHFGIQESAEKFYMINTALLPEHRGRGVYTALLKRVLDILRAEAFQIVYSRHAATNNQVIVPKLKAGFIITGFELSDRFGTLVHLSYFFNPMRRRVLDVRAGQVRPDAEVLRHMPPADPNAT
jgi:GNAT superfamily N-acetyltransferase